MSCLDTRMGTHEWIKAESRARASFAEGFPMTAFLSCLRDAVVICRTVIGREWPDTIDDSERQEDGSARRTLKVHVANRVYSAAEG